MDITKNKDIVKAITFAMQLLERANGDADLTEMILKDLCRTANGASCTG